MTETFWVIFPNQRTHNQVTQSILAPSCSIRFCVPAENRVSTTTEDMGGIAPNFLFIPLQSQMYPAYQIGRRLLNLDQMWCLSNLAQRKALLSKTCDGGWQAGFIFGKYLPSRRPSSSKSTIKAHPLICYQKNSKNPFRSCGSYWNYLLKYHNR